MIARPETLGSDPLATVMAEAARDMLDACYVVQSDDDRAALESYVGLPVVALVAGRPWLERDAADALRVRAKEAGHV